MAIPTVREMVTDRLPYLTPGSNDVQVERMRIKMVYLMQSQTGKSDADVEPEANYKAIENILFADMVSYQLVKTKAIQTMAGDGSAAGGGAKILKRAKADVTEAEFIVTKAEDGSLIQMSTTTFLADLLKEICSTGNSIGYTVPWCTCEPDIIPAFIVGEDFPKDYCPPDIFNGNPIGS
jgi:hypothetical protein